MRSRIGRGCDRRVHSGGGKRRDERRRRRRRSPRSSSSPADARSATSTPQHLLSQHRQNSRPKATHPLSCSSPLAAFGQHKHTQTERRGHEREERGAKRRRSKDHLSPRAPVDGAHRQQGRRGGAVQDGAAADAQLWQPGGGGGRGGVGEEQEEERGAVDRSARERETESFTDAKARRRGSPPGASRRCLIG